MFSTLLASPKNAPSESAFSRLGISRAPSSSQRGFLGTPAEPPASRKVRQNNTATKQRATPGAHSLERPKTKEKSPLGSLRGPERRNSPERIKPKLKTRPSSPLLGEHYRRITPTSGGAVNAKSHTVKTSGSDSSMNSQYDALKSPLSISQQTSASAARNYDTKKGQTPIMSISDRGHHPTNQRDVSHIDNQSSKSSKSNKSGFLSLRPRHIDLSSLFPKPTATKRPLLSPQRNTHSPSPSSKASGNLTQLHATNAPLLTKTSKPTKPDRQRSQPSGHKSYSRADPFASKVNARRPSVRIQNWFDGPEGNVSDDDEILSQPKLNSNSPAHAPGESFMPRNDDQDNLYSQRMLNITDNPLLPIDPRPRSPNFLLSSGASAFSLPVAPPALPTRNYRRRVAMSMSSKRSKTSTLELANLMNESVLSMSSSEEESENEFSTSPRNSIVSSYVQGLSAQAARFRPEDAGSDSGVRETPLSGQYSNSIYRDRMSVSAASGPRHLFSRVSQVSQTSNPRLDELSKHDHNVNMHKQVRYSPEKSAWKPLGNHVQRVNARSPTDQRSILTSESGLPRKTSIRTMTVTREEEALLEAMRQKKAAMKQRGFGGQIKSNADFPFTHDVTYSSDQRRQRTKVPESPETVLPRQTFDQPRSQTITISEDHPMKTGLYLTSSEASSPDQAFFAQFRQSSMVPSVFGPSPTTDSRDSPSPVTPPQSTLHEELPPLRISTLRPLDPGSQLVRSGQRWTPNSGLMMNGGPDFEDSIQVEDSHGWALRGVRKGRNGVAVAT